VCNRYYGHFEGDAQAYRDQAELQAERAVSDPLPRFLADPRAAALSEEKIAEIDAAILAEIDRGFEVTYAAADPTPDKLFTDVYIHYEGRLQ
jgi:pyruvate dehydrogenase E1 component alpha subunit